MKGPHVWSESLLAPCGMNCAVCYAHLRDRKPCPGCHGEDDQKPKHCRTCRYKECATEHGVAFCVDCEGFPCPQMRRFDKSYRTRYGASLVEMAQRMREVGTTAYLEEQERAWTCAECEGVISLHDRACSACGSKLPDKE